MTRRENLLRAVRREPHEFLPAYFPVDSFNLPRGVPDALIDREKLATYDNPEEVIEASRYFGLDCVVRLTPSAVSADNPASVDKLADGRQLTAWKTARGELRQIDVLSPEGETRFITEHPIRELADYEILLDYIDSCSFTVSEEGIARTRKVLADLGEDGIAYAMCPSTPIMDLVRTWVGLEQFTYHLADEPKLVHAVLSAMAEHAYRQYELIAKHTPCQVLVLYDDASSLLISRDMFERYSVPVLRRYAEIAHAHGKILVNHTCGKIAAFLDLYGETGNDSFDWLTPPPTGDVEPSRAHEVLGDRMSLQVALVPAVLRYGTPAEVERHVLELTRAFDHRDAFVLMAPTPNGSPLENARAVVRLLASRFGRPLGRSDRFGSILD